MAASTKQSKKEIESEHKVWDTYKHKLLIYVMDGINVAAKDSNGKSDPFVVIEHGKYKKQTTIQEKTLNPKWNELFFIQADPNEPVKLEMWDHDMIGSPDYMGHVLLELKTMPEDRVMDIFPNLLPRVTKKKEVISGQLHLRVYHSSAKETRPDGNPENMQFLYKPFKHMFKPGDLIGYSGHGIVAALQKVYTNNPITSVGMVVYLPNKWTGDIEPYVVELTRNVNRNVDAFMEIGSKSGIHIFRLFERLHHFHGANVVHFPLKQPIPGDGYKRIVERLWEYHKKNGFLTQQNDNYKYGSYYTPLTTFIKQKKNWVFAKNVKMVEASSFDFVCRLLRESGVLSLEFADPADILKSHLYNAPLLIRQVANEPPLYFEKTPVIVPVPLPPQAQEPPPPYTTHPIPAYTPDPRKSVALSHLEFTILMSMLDGVLLDDKLAVNKEDFRAKMIEKGIEGFKNDQKFEAFYAALDADKDGTVDLKELVCGFAVFLEGSADEKLITAFRVFDRDGDNYITKAELRTLLSVLLKAVSTGNAVPFNAVEHNAVVEEFVTQIFAEFDKNNDGKLSVDEFMAAAHNNTSIGNLFLTVASLSKE